MKAKHKIIFYKQERKKSLFLILIVLFSLLINNNLQADGDDDGKITTVVIDPGHGGKDPGAVCSLGYEKDIVLKIGLKLGNYIKENCEDVKVIYTRDDDTFIPLYKRAKIANNNNADIFISIHANANKSYKPYGSETYIMGLHKSQSNLAVAKKENSVILQEENYEERYSGYDPNSPESHIIFTLYQNAFLEQSIKLAAKIQYQFKERVKRKDRGVKQAGFLVLWKTTMPSLLIELGFISNKNEAKFLFSEQGQDYMASAIYRAFRDYKDDFEKENKDNIICNKEVMDSLKAIDSIKINTNKNQIVFKVQIAASNKIIKTIPENFKGIEDVEMIKIGNTYKYTTGNCHNLDSVLILQKKIRKKYPESFVIAFKNNKKISLKEAKKELKN